MATSGLSLPRHLVVLESQLTFGAELGRGSFGIVQAGTINGQPVCIKARLFELPNFVLSCSVYCRFLVGCRVLSCSLFMPFVILSYMV